MPELDGRLARSAYTAALYGVTPLIAPWFLVRGVFHGKYLKLLPERLGWRAPRAIPPAGIGGVVGGVWLHAVSVGEVLAARTLARALVRGGAGPLVLSSTTAAGYQLARAARTAGEVAVAIASPLDYPGAVRQAFDRVKPRAILLMEGELWPNWLAEAARRDLPVALVNARIGPRSYLGYRRFGRLFRPLFASLAAVGACNEGDAERIVALGTPWRRVTVTGQLKYDAEPPRWSRADARSQLRLPASSFVFVAGSILEGEAAGVISAFRALLGVRPDAVLLLAPRKPFELPPGAAGLAVVRRTKKAAVCPGGVLLLDTVGELKDAYAAGDLAFVGGSLVSAGGHNVLEPAAAGLPVLFGPSVDNFMVPAMRLLAEGAGIQVGGPDALGQEVVRLARDAPTRAAMGQRALGVVETGRGALARTLELLGPLL